MTNPITEAKRATLIKHRDHRLTYGKAMLRAIGDRFVMEGPSGKHSLLIEATDAARLSVHWAYFATHSANV